MVTREHIKALQERAMAAEDFMLIGVTTVALALGPDCYGWYVCEEAIEEGK